METLFTVTVLGMLLTDGAGMTDQQEQEYADTQKRICAAGEVRDTTLSLRGCVLDEVQRKRAALMRDLKAGEWSRRR